MLINNKTPMGDNLIKKRINHIVLNTGYDIDVSNIICNLYDYMRHANRQGLRGGCHALSSVFYVAFSELGYSPELFIGECQKSGEKPFDHSWITMNGAILDIAVYMPLVGAIGSVTGPIIFDIDILTMEKTETNYGINTGLPMDNQTLFVINNSFSKYMMNFPFERGGLWTVVKKVLPSSVHVDIQALSKKYSDVSRHFVR